MTRAGKGGLGRGPVFRGRRPVGSQYNGLFVQLLEQPDDGSMVDRNVSGSPNGPNGALTVGDATDASDASDASSV